MSLPDNQDSVVRSKLDGAQSQRFFTVVEFSVQICPEEKQSVVTELCWFEFLDETIITALSGTYVLSGLRCNKTK